jgi:flagellar biosynthesis GTPase FlhF
MHARVRTLAVLPSLTILLAAGAGSFVAFADDVLAQFEQTPAKAQEAVMSAVWAGGQPYIDGSWVIFRALSPAARAAAVRAAADFARAYASSDAFKKQYAANRASRAPKLPVPPKSWAEQHAEQNAQFAKSMADMKANLPKMPANMQKSMQDTIDQMQAQHEAQEKDAALQAMMEKSVTMGYENEKQQYARQLKQFELEHPGDPNALVATRLKEFLAMSATVPAEAQLVPANGKMKFADKSLEGKPYFWKQCFRAGKPSVDAAREAAEAWLKAIQ